MRDFSQTSHYLRRRDLENIVLTNRGSLMALVVDEDAVYVVGYFADIRGMPVSSDLRRWAKDEIALRLRVHEELKPHTDDLSYSHRRADNS